MYTISSKIKYSIRNSYYLIVFGWIFVFILTTALFHMNLSIYNSNPSININEDPWKDEPFIFIGGFPRSGTTLMRILLDVHPEISCGPETHISPNVAYIGSNVIRSRRFLDRIKAAQLWPGPFSRAFRSFFYEILEGSRRDKKFKCSKDPFMLRNIDFLNYLYPNAKFIHMVRDGRGVVASVKKRHVGIGHIDTNDPFSILSSWNNTVSQIDSLCSNVTDKICMTVRYEDLVLRPSETTHKIANFLNVKWTKNFINHYNLIQNKVYLSPFEMSNSQVVNPINIEAVYSWAKEGTVLSDEFMRTADTSMLRKFQYVPNSLPPYYGEPEPEVFKNHVRMMRDSNIKAVFSPDEQPKRNPLQIMLEFENANESSP